MAMTVAEQQGGAQPTVVIESRRIHRWISPQDAMPTQTPTEMAARYGTFEFDLADTDNDLPRLLGGSHHGLYGPVLSAHLADGTPIAVKVFSLRYGIEYDRLKSIAAHEYRRSVVDLGPRFVRGYALLEVWSVDADAVPMFLLVMELLKGQGLDQASAPEPGLQQLWLDQTLEALEILEEHRLRWQDIKPQNIMARDDDSLVFIDHGSSRALGAGTETNTDRTPAWLAPEFFDTGQFSEATMRFSAGLSMLSVFTGGRPYLEDRHNVRNATATADPAYDGRTRHGVLNLHDDRLAPPVRPILGLMLHPDPSKRPAPGMLREALHDPNFEADKTLSQVAAHPYERVPATDVEPAHDHSIPEEPVWEDLPSPPPEDVEREHVSGPQERKSARLPPGDDSREGLEDLHVDLLPLKLPDDEPRAARSWLIKHTGVDPTMVTAPGERAQYRFVAVGLIIYRLYIVVGVFSVGYQMTDSVRAALVGACTIGLILGWALVNFDRSIVGFIRPNLNIPNDGDGSEALFTKGWSYWLNIGARVLATIFVAFLVGDSVNVLIHQKDIAANLATHQAVELEALQEEADERFRSQEASLAAAVKTAQNAYNTAKGTGERLRDQADGERDGTSGTGIPGCGPGSHCQRYLAEAHDADQYFQQNQKRLTGAITTAQDNLAELSAAKNAWMAPREAEIQRRNGPLAQSKALWEIATSDWLSRLRYVALLLVFATIELLAVVMKLSLSGNVYERSIARRAQLAELADRHRRAIERTYIDRAADENKQIVETAAGLGGAQRALALERYARRLRAEQGSGGPVSPPPPVE